MFYRLLISLPMMVCFFWSIFFIIRYLNNNEEKHAKRSILIFYIAATILYIDHWMFFSGIVCLWSEWSYCVANLSVYPLYYAYLNALTRTRGSREVQLLLLPALLASILFPIGHFYPGTFNAAMTVIFRFCFFLQVVWVMTRGYLLLLRTTKRMDDTYSDNRSQLLNPIYTLLILFCITAVASMTLNFFGRNFFAHDMLVTLPSIIMSCLLYSLGYVAAHTVIPPETVDNDINAIDPATNEWSNDLIHKIDAVMREKMLFTRPNLTIQDLANAVSSNRTYVSNAINRTYGISFSQYVAKQRVEYAKMILRDPRYTSSKDAIADAISLSGFTSDKTFYRIFKDHTSLTPLAYRKSTT